MSGGFSLGGGSLEVKEVKGVKEVDEVKEEGSEYYILVKILGVDWGEKRIGVAIARGNLAEPLGVVGSFEELVKIVRQEGIRQIVLGLPEGKLEIRVRKWGKKLEEDLGIPVVLRNEVLTSRVALEKAIQAGKPRKKRRTLDSFSAALLLQEYLDENRGS